jgi:hypothetical protein
MPSRRKKGSGCLKLLFGVVAICVILAIVFRNPEIGTERKNESQSSAAAQTIFDVINSYELRSGPGSEHPRIVNTNASDQLDEIHYLSVDSSVTVQIIATQGEWAEIQVTQPEFLRTTHRGWLPKRVLKDGPATEKLDGWIRRTCRVYPARDKAVKLLVRAVISWSCGRRKPLAATYSRPHQKRSNEYVHRKLGIRGWALHREFEFYDGASRQLAQLIHSAL